MHAACADDLGPEHECYVEGNEEDRFFLQQRGECQDPSNHEQGCYDYGFCDASATGNGVGEHKLEGISQVRLQMVWQDEARPVDDRSRCTEGWIPRSEGLGS